MPSYYTSAGQTLRELADCFRQWGVEQYTIAPQRRGGHWPGYAREVSISWTSPDGRPVTLSCDQEYRPDDNLRALYLCIRDLRLQEVRGVAAMMATAYAQLAAPVERDPFEVLGVRSDASPTTINAAYRALAAEAHPDKGGSSERMAELNAARDELRARRLLS